MFVQAELHLITNLNKERVLPVEVDIEEGLVNFKRQLLQESKLSPAMHEKYVLSYHYMGYFPVDADAVVPFYMPIVTDEQLAAFILMSL
jgi:hypothetical protein